MKTAKPKMFEEAEISRVNNIFLQVLIFLTVFFVIAIAESIIPLILMMGDILEYFESGQFTGVNDEYLQFISSLQYQDKFMIASLFSTFAGTAISIVYCRFIEKRPVSSMGVRKEKGIKNYLFGMITGFVMLTAVVLLNILFGSMNFEGFNSDVNWLIIILYFFSFLVQGMSEEFIFRGFLMNSVGGKHGIVLAVLISSMSFSLAHIFNQGVTVLALVNIMLFGAFMSVYMICSDNIWGVSAIHSLWNFSQGNIFGISVSGTGSIQTVFITSSNSSKAILNGGSFGIEGGICTTIVLVLSFIILFTYQENKKAVV